MLQCTPSITMHIAPLLESPLKLPLGCHLSVGERGAEREREAESVKGPAVHDVVSCCEWGSSREELRVARHHSANEHR